MYYLSKHFPIEFHSGKDEDIEVTRGEKEAFSEGLFCVVTRKQIETVRTGHWR